MELRIVHPVSNCQHFLTPAPAMPILGFLARFQGIEPDPTATLQYHWSLRITETVGPSTCPSSRVKTTTLKVQRKNVPGGLWTPQFPHLQGGDAIVEVSTTFNGRQFQASLPVRFRGVNPDPAMVKEFLQGEDPLACEIAELGSGLRQFDGRGLPLTGPKGAVGLFQLCDPPATGEQRWNWQTNLQAGLLRLKKTKSEAREYLDHHHYQSNYPNDQGCSAEEVFRREVVARYFFQVYWVWDDSQEVWRGRSPENGA